MFSTLFVSHGAPNIILQDSSIKRNLKELAQSFERPKYIIIFSAHYTTKELSIINYETEGLMYDFYGFEKELYEFEYPIKSDKEITFKILEHLKNNFIDAKIDANRRTYDHGVWSVLSMMYKALSIPVIQLSIPLSYSNQELIKLGESLKVFKDEALIVTSGCLTHNLRDMGFASGIKEYAKKFSQDVVEIIKIGDTQKLLDITSDENFYKNHPTDEHFLPLFIAYGASDDKHGISFNSEITYSNISMESFVFDKSV